MEPQLEGCGKRNGQDHGPAMGGASMEPQLEGCGKGAQLGAKDLADKASMEPQLEGCGKLSGTQRGGARILRFNGAAT